MKKKKTADIVEELEAVGQESDRRAAKWVKEVEEEKQKTEKNKEAIALELLDTIKKNNKVYCERLMGLLHALIYSIPLPSSYQWGVWYDQGLIIRIIDPQGKRHTRAMKPSYIPKYDHHAIQEFALWAEDIVDLQTQRKDTSSIWTPNKN